MADDKNDHNNGEIPIILWADLESAPLGQSSKLLEDLAGRPVLRQTLERVCRSKKSGRKLVYCRPEQVEKIQTVLAGLPLQVIPIDVKLPGWWPAMQTTRKWAMTCWRGGLLGSFAFDETRPDGAMQKLLDGNRFHKLTGWKPQMTLREGIEKTVAWYRQNVEPEVIHARS